jgi:F-type H+/Na+-transporting ATPase subunit alpha
MPVEKQIVGMFAGTNGYLDPVPAEDVQRFEKELHEFVEMKYPDIYTTISGTKDLSEQTTTKLHEILKEFSGKFRPTGKAS